MGIIVGIVLILVFLLWKTGREEQSHNKQLEQMDKELIPLNVEKRDLEKKIIDLKKMTEDKGTSKGTTTVLFTEINEMVYTGAYPILKEHGYVGVLALSGTQLPGLDGCISVQQFEELLSAGWSYCVSWIDHEVVNNWLKTQNKTQGTVAYFPDRTYRKNYEAEVSAAGYTTIVRRDNDEMTLTAPTRKDGIWHADLSGVLANDPRKQLENTMEQGGHIVYGVGFTKKAEMYDEDIFLLMLKWFKSYEEEGNLLVTDFAGARTYHEEMEWKRNISEEQFQIEKDKIEEQIKEIEKQIDAIYEKYE